MIADATRQGLSGRRIAALLPGRAVSTICREIKRNSETGGGYEPFQAQNKMIGRRPRPKGFKLADPVVNGEVQSMLDKQWSPEQISASLAKRADGPRVSAESIYRGIYNPLIPLRREKALRTRRLQRRTRRAVGERQQRFVAPMRPVSERSEKAADRSEAGHWEGDLIVGEFNGSAIATLVERVTRYTMVVYLDGARTADQVSAAITDRFNEIPAHLRLSLTWDQGIEMARHHEFTESTGIPVFFCDPRSPWQRPSNENTNGLLRGYFPKSTDLYQHSAERLNYTPDVGVLA